MKRTILLLFIYFLIYSFNLYSQSFGLDKSKFDAVNVYMTFQKFMGKDAIKVIKDSTIKDSDAPTFVRLKGIEFKNGTIEVKVLSRLLPHAPQSARGFIGIAFRIKEDTSAFESIYIRPTNGRANEQLRRNHSIQYFSYPGFSFDRLRKEAPGEYESYADMGLNEWINLKIVVRDLQAKLFINDSRQPALIVNDLKHGADLSGTIGLFVDIGTEGFFSDLKINGQLKALLTQKK